MGGSTHIMFSPSSFSFSIGCMYTISLSDSSLNQFFCKICRVSVDIERHLHDLSVQIAPTFYNTFHIITIFLLFSAFCGEQPAIRHCVHRRTQTSAARFLLGSVADAATDTPGLYWWWWWWWGWWWCCCCCCCCCCNMFCISGAQMWCSSDFFFSSNS